MVDGDRFFGWPCIARMFMRSGMGDLPFGLFHADGPGAPSCKSHFGTHTGAGRAGVPGASFQAEPMGPVDRTGCI